MQFKVLSLFKPAHVTHYSIVLIQDVQFIEHCWQLSSMPLSINPILQLNSLIFQLIYAQRLFTELQGFLFVPLQDRQFGAEFKQVRH